jgi:hypothetical protein
MASLTNMKNFIADTENTFLQTHDFDITQITGCLYLGSLQHSLDLALLEHHKIKTIILVTSNSKLSKSVSSVSSGPSTKLSRIAEAVKQLELKRAYDKLNITLVPVTVTTETSHDGNMARSVPSKSLVTTFGEAQKHIDEEVLNARSVLVVEALDSRCAFSSILIMYYLLAHLYESTMPTSSTGPTTMVSSPMTTQGFVDTYVFCKFKYSGMSPNLAYLTQLRVHDFSS